MSTDSAIPTALYRAYRPQHFYDLVGQDSVRTTLLGAVSSGRIGHAYLLTGPRGTGKTSTARILARAATCQQPQNGEPCDTCVPCRALLRGGCLDLVEIDAASHTSVDSVRELIAALPYRPTILRTKVVIIDEVHGLSAPAFNALLKNLEEPPSHILFILATTEVHKVPATVASRCQRLTFGLLAHSTITTRLESVANAEGLTWTSGALDLLATHACGSLRDALALLDQARAHNTTGHLDEDAVIDALGFPPRPLINTLADAIVRGTTGLALAQVAQACARDMDIRLLWRALIAHFHQVLLYSTGYRPPATEPPVPPEIIAQAQHLGTPRALALLRVLQQERVARSWTDQWHLDTCVAQACLLAAPEGVLPPPTLAPFPPPPFIASCLELPPPPQKQPQETPALASSPDSPEQPQETLPSISTPTVPTAPDKSQGTPLGSAHELWRATQDLLRAQDKKHILHHTEDGSPTNLTQTALTVAFSIQLHKERCEKPHHRTTIEDALSHVAARPLALICHLKSSSPDTPDPHETHVQEVTTDLRNAYEQRMSTKKKGQPHVNR